MNLNNVTYGSLGLILIFGIWLIILLTEKIIEKWRKT